MCYDLAKFDPFEPLYLYDYGYAELELDNEPMNDYDWEEFLETNGE